MLVGLSPNDSPSAGYLLLPSDPWIYSRHLGSMVFNNLDHVPGHSRSHTEEARGIDALSCHVGVKFRDAFIYIVSGYGA